MTLQKTETQLTLRGHNGEPLITSSASLSAAAKRKHSLTVMNGKRGTSKRTRVLQGYFAAQEAREALKSTTNLVPTAELNPKHKTQ